MKHLHHWILALLVTGSAGFSGAYAKVQAGQEPAKEPPKQEPAKQEPPKKEKEFPRKETLPMSDLPSKELEWRDRAVRLELIRKALPGFKVTLAEAAQLAEKETGGKAFSADVELTPDKPLYKINVFIGEQHTSVMVDPITKKVSITGRKPGDPEKPVPEKPAEGEKPAGDGSGG